MAGAEVADTGVAGTGLAGTGLPGTGLAGPVRPDHGSLTSITSARTHRPGCTMAEPRPSCSALAPSSWNVARAGPVSSVTGSPMHRMARTRTGRMAGAITSSSPVRTVPAASVPVMAVAPPAAQNEWSTQTRTGAPGSGTGEAAGQAAERADQFRHALAGDRAHGEGLHVTQAGCGDLPAGLGQRRAGVGEIGAGDDEEPTADPEGVQHGELPGRLRAPSGVGGHGEQHGGRGPGAGQQIRDAALLPGHIDEREPLP